MMQRKAAHAAGAASQCLLKPLPHRMRLATGDHFPDFNERNKLIRFSRNFSSTRLLNPRSRRREFLPLL
jgi:hypothetical protein